MNNNVFEGLQWGFEVECCVKRKFNSEVRSLLKSIEGISLKNDWTIEPKEYDYSMEIVTPVLPSCESFEVLTKVFDIMADKCYSNKSCGFHINISFIDKEMVNYFTPHIFCVDPLWPRLLTSFGRRRNNFCYYYPNGNAIDKLKEFNRCLREYSIKEAFSYKQSCVSLDYYMSKRWPKTRRIEIRGMGNTNYEKKHELIGHYLQEIARLMKKSHIKL